MPRRWEEVSYPFSSAPELALRSHRPSSIVPRALPTALALVLACAAIPARALAGPVETDEAPVHPRHEIDPRLELDPGVDLEDPPRARLPSPLHAPMWLALSATLRRRQAGDAALGGMLVLGLPLDRVVGRDRRAAVVAEGPPEADEGTPADAPRAEASAPDPPAPPVEPSPRGKGAVAPAPRASPPPGARPRPLRVPVTVTPDAARAAVDAALHHARLADPELRLDALASRARTSAALPELRLRVLRLVSQGEALAPTAYDPTRTTMKDGASFWLEARGTWRLDRLLFADEEVALERMRHDRADARSRLTSRVLKLLFDWQRALAGADNPAASPEEKLAARLRAIEAEAEVDLLTDGWFSRWRAGPTTVR